MIKGIFIFRWYRYTGGEVYQYTEGPGETV